MPGCSHGWMAGWVSASPPLGWLTAGWLCYRLTTLWAVPWLATSAPGLTPANHADFGLCELLDPGHTHVSNHNKGTPFYAAPETMMHAQVCGEGPEP